MSDSSELVIYQIKVVLLGISPMIWRRLLVKSDSTLEDLHYILQIAMGWLGIEPRCVEFPARWSESPHPVWVWKFTTSKLKKPLFATENQAV